MATRTQAREAVIQLLYAHEMGCDNIDKLSEIVLQDYKLRDKHASFARTLLYGVLEREKILAQVAAAFLKSWDITRLGVVEKGILMLGIYELLESELDSAIVINEAIELTRTFNVGDAAKLVNGVLDSVAKKSADEIADMIESSSKTKAIDTRLFIDVVNDEAKVALKVRTGLDSTSNSTRNLPRPAKHSKGDKKLFFKKDSKKTHKFSKDSKKTNNNTNLTKTPKNKDSKDL